MSRQNTTDTSAIPLRPIEEGKSGFGGPTRTRTGFSDASTAISHGSPAIPQTTGASGFSGESSVMTRRTNDSLRSYDADPVRWLAENPMPSWGPGGPPGGTRNSPAADGRAGVSEGSLTSQGGSQRDGPTSHHTGSGETRSASPSIESTYSAETPVQQADESSAATTNGAHKHSRSCGCVVI